MTGAADEMYHFSDQRINFLAQLVRSSFLISKPLQAMS